MLTGRSNAAGSLLPSLEGCLHQLGLLVQLVQLNLAGNYLATLPEGISKLSNLQVGCWPVAAGCWLHCDMYTPAC